LAQKEYRVHPRQEQVAGAWCHVVEFPGVDKLWVDPAIGFAVRRREGSAGNPPALVARYELSDYRETAPGVWLPWKLRRVNYKIRPPSTQGDPLPEADSVATVARVEVNQVDSDLFRFTPPPGTLVQDRDAGEMSQIPGGL